MQTFSGKIQGRYIWHTYFFCDGLVAAGSMPFLDQADARPTPLTSRKTRTLSPTAPARVSLLAPAQAVTLRFPCRSQPSQLTATLDTGEPRTNADNVRADTPQLTRHSENFRGGGYFAEAILPPDAN